MPYLIAERSPCPRPRPPLEPLLRARSVAVVGASATPGTFGHALLRQLIHGNYAGAVYPVNPGRAEIDGVRCYPALADLPERVDCALLAVADERLEEALRAVGEAGIPAAVVFGGLAVAATSPRPNPSPCAQGEGLRDGEINFGHGMQVEPALSLPDRLRGIASAAGIALLGGNAMGFYNTGGRLFVSGYPPAEPLPEGRIAFISHSGSAFSAFANNRRGLRFSYLISPGQEVILTAADYLRFAIAQPETRAVGLFLETVRDPDEFVAALEEAAQRAIPIVSLKVGRSERGRMMSLSHSGALAGSDEAFSALCERWGIIQTRSLDELADTLELLAAPRRPRGGGLALAGDSGGERALIVDRAVELGVPWAALEDATLETIAAALDPGLEAANPLDLWGSGRDWRRVYETCLAAMARDPAAGIVVLAVDLVVGSRLVPGYLEAVESVSDATDAPVAVLGNLASAIDPTAAARLRERGIPVLMGTDTGLAALGHALSWRPAAPPVPLDAETREHAARWLAALAGRPRPLDEVEAKRLLADWGIPVVAERPVESQDEAIAAARVLGWPIALKTAAPWLLHKSDVGGVVLHLEDEAAVATAYADLRDRFGPPVVVQRQISTKDHVEMFLGMTVDPQFGPLISVGLGGIWVEALHDVVSALAPIDAEDVAGLLLRLRGAPLLRGARGTPAVDLDALSAAVAAFSRMAAALASVVDQIDVNPLLAGPHGVVAIDALVVLRPEA